MRHPLAIDIFCGLGGWTEGLLAEGFYVVGFDIERHRYWMPEEMPGNADGSKGTKPVEKRGWTQGCAVSLGMEGATAKPRTRLVEYPAQLVLQDVLTLHGSQFKDAALIVASPPCQAYSYRAMPWKRAKALPPPDNSLFEACFRIQREACEAAGRHIPLVVENVRGAQKWVGRSRWNFGSFHLWGDVPALMPMTIRRGVEVPGLNWSGSDKPGYVARAFNDTAIKNNGGSWFAIAHNTTSGHSNNARDQLIAEGRKTHDLVNKRDGHSHTLHLTNQAEHDGVKNGADWFGSGADCSLQRRAGSKSNARKAASAAIAKIPFELARHIARTYYPSRAQFADQVSEVAA